MGLDSYLYKEEIGDTKFSLPAPLVGGMFSDHGEDGSFRGKVYDGFMVEATGFTLYVEEYPPEKVEEIARKLEEFWEKHKNDLESEFKRRWGIPKKEAQALVELFVQAAEEGCKYRGWG